MPNQGRPKGYPKTGGAKKGSIKTNTRAVKDAIRNVFYDRLGGEDYLEKLAKSDPALFTSLLAKLIPQEVAAEINVNHRTVDLGAAMREAGARLERLYPGPMINVTPETKNVRSD
tara:strand:+ start:4050 stop:4394 length:345 start_codon:yes stop_codon:yes gene_type:complete